MSNDLLIYTIGKHDVQWIYKDANHQSFRMKAGFSGDAMNIKDNILSDSSAISYIEESDKYPEKQSKQVIKDSIIGFGFPIFEKTLRSVIEYIHQHSKGNDYGVEEKHLDILFINTNRQRFLEKKFADSLTPEAKSYFNSIINHLKQEASDLTDVFKNQWHSMACINLHSCIFLDLGSIGFFSDEEVQKDPAMLDFNNRNYLFPYLSRLFIDSPAVEADIYLFINNKTGIKKIPLSDLVKNAKECFITSNTGLPTVNQILQSIIAAARRMSAQHKSSPILIPQPEYIANIPFRPFLHYEAFMEIRYMLSELYGKIEFQTAYMYLKTLPKALRKNLKIIKKHREFNKYVTRYLRYSYKKNTYHPLIIKGIDNYGISIETLNNPAFRLQQKVIYELNKERFSDAAVAIVTLRDVVTRETLNHLVKNIVTDQGFLDNNILKTIFKKPPEWLGKNDKTAIDYNALEKIANSNLSEPKKDVIKNWLMLFWDSLKDICKIRNQNVHEGIFEHKGKEALIKCLYENNFKVYEKNRGNILFFKKLSDIAVKKGIEKIFPVYKDIWKPISQAAKDDIENYSLSNFMSNVEK
ncbi:MAG: hypothetical protein HQK79_19900 [Desulfobacterales bacterium]|nr:hypothetical protein [Desulfobacterales bacterium]